MRTALVALAGLVADAGRATSTEGLVTDAMAATNSPDGHYLLGELDVTVADVLGERGTERDPAVVRQG